MTSLAQLFWRLCLPIISGQRRCSPLVAYSLRFRRLWACVCAISDELNRQGDTGGPPAIPPYSVAISTCTGLLQSGSEELSLFQYTMLNQVSKRLAALKEGIGDNWVFSPQ